jgi:long-chain acyl-CoA synthetase
MSHKIYTAPPGSGQAVRGKTITELLYTAESQHPNSRALNHPRGEGNWQTWSTAEFRQEAEDIANGLIGLGMEPGSHLATFMESDAYFCLVDMGCLMAQVIDVPIYLTHKDEQIEYVIKHSESSIVAVSEPAHLEQIAPMLGRLEKVTHVIVAEAKGDLSDKFDDRVEVLSLETLRERGRKYASDNPDALKRRLEAIKSDDLATIIYTSGTTGDPKGVMLTHENISYNAMTAFSGLHDYVKGEGGEVALSFLPLTHIFARTLHYGLVASGSEIYFTTPDDLARDLKIVRPSILASVPRVLEKVYGRILERVNDLSGVQASLLKWSIDLAGQYELGKEPSAWWKLQQKVADALVYKKWREALGGRAKYIIAGGAALSGHLANTFSAAGVTILQGYGLTETSPVITYNRPDMNRAGTVGVPIPDVEVSITDDGEIITRGPHIMVGYYKDEERTKEVIDDDGWFHTGDIGEVTAEGYLMITDRKKDLFKLSTGKYVTPQPLETQLAADPLIEQAVVIGEGHKFCTALIFPEKDALRSAARSEGLSDADEAENLVKSPKIIKRFEELVAQANKRVDKWSEIKRFAVVAAQLTPENGMLTPTMKVRRPQVKKEFEEEINALYEEQPTSNKEMSRAALIMQ